MTAREVMRLIERNGGILLRQRGSHTARHFASDRARPGAGVREGMAEGTMKYHVVVTRDGDGWMADVPALPGTHTWAKTLRALDRNIREVVGMVEDLPRSGEAGLVLDTGSRTGDPGFDPPSSRRRAKRKEVERDAAEVASHTRQLAEQLD